MKKIIFAACIVIAANFAAAAQVGTNKPAIEYDSLMNMRFYEETGGFLVEGLEVVFPPSAASAATFVITKPNGEVISSVPLRLEPLEKFPACPGLRLPHRIPNSGTDSGFVSVEMQTLYSGVLSGARVLSNF